jgi:hypothetical protein
MTSDVGDPRTVGLLQGRGESISCWLSEGDVEAHALGALVEFAARTIGTC